MNKVRFAVVGVHSIARHHIDGINKLPQAELIAVCDIHEEYAKKRAAENGLDKYYLDYDQMLADGGFDCVVICTPDQVHAEQAVKALEAGYHVLCEKPLAMKMEDVAAIVAAAKKSGKKFMVGQVCRKTPAFIAAKHLFACFFKFFDFCTLATDYHTRFCAVNVNANSLRISFDFYLWNTCRSECLKEIFTKFVVRNKCVTEV